MAQYTFKTDDGLYDVEKLNDTAKTAFNYLAEIQTEVQGLSKRIDVLQAASSAYNAAIMDNLDEEALINEEEEVAQLEED
ncbi:MAG: hypothetical protein CMJ25_01825 [Phycisphaerae bacterium]|jgi:hypothetical protein|nr:hypothetical protein [Phycisphaerae bacterium]